MQIQGKYRCINCFNEITNPDVTCSCGYNSNQYKTLSYWLYPGTILDNRYYVGRVIGEGGFGITYVGYDINLDIKVAIKEFFLSGINSRNATISNNIETGTEDRETLFEAHREKFINEARMLAKFNDEKRFCASSSEKAPFLTPPLRCFMSNTPSPERMKRAVSVIWAPTPTQYKARSKLRSTLAGLVLGL